MRCVASLLVYIYTVLVCIKQLLSCRVVCLAGAGSGEAAGGRRRCRSGQWRIGATCCLLP